MILLGDPDYSRTTLLNNGNLAAMSFAEVLNSYTAINVTFEFPETVKYPSIACQVDDTLNIYPLKGESTITGLDYLLAKKQGCKVNVISGYTVPFKHFNRIEDVERRKIVALFEESEVDLFDEEFKMYLEGYRSNKPYDNVIKELIAKRKEHPKKSFLNQMYKEITNSIYGLTAMGLASKKKFDVKTKETKQLEGSDLSNPLIASYITSFVRVVVGECLQNLQEINGNVISVTTDGFITDVEDLEEKLLALDNSKSLFLRIFLNLRRFVTNPGERCLELKNVEGDGVKSGGEEEEEVERGILS